MRFRQETFTVEASLAQSPTKALDYIDANFTMIANGQIHNRNATDGSLRMLQTGIVFGGLAVILGAFGAHGVEAYLADQLAEDKNSPEMLRLTGGWETAARYHMYHALAIIALSIVDRRSPSRWTWIGFVLFLVGILVFSGGLYWWVMSIGQVRLAVQIVPLGGLCFILGWLMFFLSTLKRPK